MNWLELGALGLLALAAELARRLAAPAREGRHHHPVALTLGALLALDVTRELLRLLVLAPARAQLGLAPYEGFARAAFHTEQALLLAFPLVQLGLYGSLLLRTKHHPWVIGTVWLELVLIAVTHYPHLRRARLLVFYASESKACAVVAGLSIAVYLVAVALQRCKPSTRELCALTLAGSDLAALVGPYLLPERAQADWWLAHVLNLICYGLICIVQGRALWRSMNAETSAGCSSCAVSPPRSSG